ncbi:MAG: hypothetical protein J2P25_22585 [Nocardiopsaceae bacterium]|nr:hypothetical protein [Nocardiopsaceae bacterium]
MDVAALITRCRARLAEIDLPEPFDVEALCAGIGRRRGRPVALLGAELPAGAPAGMWISTEERDYIVYERATSPLHSEHIILHELSHLLCGHVGAPEISEEHASQLFPRLNPDLVRRVLGRSGYTSEEEQEAEMLASMISQRAGRQRQRPGASDPVTAGLLRRLDDAI